MPTPTINVTPRGGSRKIPVRTGNITSVSAANPGAKIIQRIGTGGIGRTQNAQLLVEESESEVKRLIEEATRRLTE